MGNSQSDNRLRRNRRLGRETPESDADQRQDSLSNNQRSAAWLRTSGVTNSSTRQQGEASFRHMDEPPSLIYMEPPQESTDLRPEDDDDMVGHSLTESEYNHLPQRAVQHDNATSHYSEYSVVYSSAYSSNEDSLSTMDAQAASVDFRPLASLNNEWMYRSIESLLLGYTHNAPILVLDEIAGENIIKYEIYGAGRRRSTASTFGGGRRRSSAGSVPGGRRGSLSLSNNMRGGTLAAYYTNTGGRRRPTADDVDRSYEPRIGRRGSTYNGPMSRRRSSIATVSLGDASAQQQRSNLMGPNVLYSIMGRESTGMTNFSRGTPLSQGLLKTGGDTLFTKLDRPAGGMAAGVAFLAAAIDGGDWTETQAIISRLAPRLIGDPFSQNQNNIEDPNLPPTAPRFYAGGGRVGLERDAFVQSGGIRVLLRMFHEKSFVGQELARTNDARDLLPKIVTTRLSVCWNETLASLRELVYSIPSVVEEQVVTQNPDFIPFLFTLLSHDSCFDNAAALIEEILSVMSQTPQPIGRSRPLATTFCLSNVPRLYSLWRGFSCRQLAHFCRILALLVFEPEDRQLLESPTVLKSIELLRLRRNRAIRAGMDSTVDINQAILLGDEELFVRLLQLLRVMNFSPSIRNFSPYHTLAQFPFVADTLIMFGLLEIESFTEAGRLEALARRMYEDEDLDRASHPINELGAVADMLEGLSESLNTESRDPTHQLGHIIHVITAAQRAGVLINRETSQRSTGTTSERQNPDGDASVYDDRRPSMSLDGSFEQLLVRRLFQGLPLPPENPTSEDAFGGEREEVINSEPDFLINTPKDAANSLQFNGMLLGPYQVEVLFVLCTLLGGRRKLDAQDMLNRLNLLPLLEEMFQRLPWYRKPGASEAELEGLRRVDEQPQGVHGPGCDCTPESALCVQYLRLLHNFCDRDCDNYHGRRLMLSAAERRQLSGGGEYHIDLDAAEPEPGLIRKIMKAFTEESDESPYRFWLASCIESYLRGSSPAEQVFAARSGLLDHLVEDISSERLHCAGSLQTSFDLLGELGKGNPDVVRLLVEDLDEGRFRKFLSVTAANLVDSNVFIRSLVLTLEGMVTIEGKSALSGPEEAQSASASDFRAYLTHSWWDTQAIPLSSDKSMQTKEEIYLNEDREPDWFAPSCLIMNLDSSCSHPRQELPAGHHESIGYYGWVFSPKDDSLNAETYLPNTIERLSWFLVANQARLLRDLLSVVDLRNINHENICCLNTAIIIVIFATRRHQMEALLRDLHKLNSEDAMARTADPPAKDDAVEDAFVQAMQSLDIGSHAPAYARRAFLNQTSAEGGAWIGDRADSLRNFREVLWFWNEYYLHRGRDRLSLEFSSHIHFQEWHRVVSLLVADTGSATSLLRSPTPLPRSPYERSLPSDAYRTT